MEYEITIKEREAYKVKNVQYEGNDGKVYTSSYDLPEGVKVKKVEYENGATSYDEKTILTQKVEELDVNAVIKAINKI